ncbi:3,4-dihydroxy 2-butanone 4-phosphate synthase [Chishuiella changwenlii]|uniref:3,4-dihydroxy-2-butanone 4-phosphate synthase n=1 Tax=Chishuiella changwenlii TaxID=1434701 RepID=A0A1M6Y4I4_9FLAO|nr:3,4-dihydroxy-2-butanone-4-phosphate synthase [Chishuiella changwenlii]GGE93586.1 3,4-dihydroxy-2-butanone 4-phosphate synthase [Chishuiella changwenlii]SHL13117.1 3,4-dihydroxy 2-butanone 4-phosphate synthase [Chishuiella changwenlii]
MKTITQFGKDANERIANAIKSLQNGKGILLVDDENRENEGDIIFPASTITTPDMALLIRECSGIICLCITQEKANELALTPMVSDNTAKFQTAFTVTIEAKEGVTTGVSAADRVQTIKTAVNPEAKPSDLNRPGHVFPLIAKANGVMERRGHTEGSIDLVRLANLGNEAVLCELTNPDGTMSKLPEIIEFAEKHNMTVLTVEDIYEYRVQLENSNVLELSN